MEWKIALAGNPNSGKTTLFNALTGSNQFVGNWPGVTVEKKEGVAVPVVPVPEEPLPEAGVSSERLPPLMVISPLSKSPLVLSVLLACLT